MVSSGVALGMIASKCWYVHCRISFGDSGPNFLIEHSSRTKLSCNLSC
jgi:hypothetical protein